MRKTKMTAKKLDAHIEKTYAIVAAGRAIDIFDIEKVFEIGQMAWAMTEDLAEVDAAIKVAVGELTQAA